ncbi:MAG TPA: lasso RiPP family leader peptide-containing protein [Reyranella sp.]|jgi:hypothetical protein
MSESNRAEEAKKAYEAPALIRWGTLREITQAVGNKGASDGGRKNQKRTSYLTAPRVLFPVDSLYSCRVKSDATTTSPQSEQDAKDADARKPYDAPVLVRWGTLHELTQSAGHKGASDGARKGANRTSW